MITTTHYDNCQCPACYHLRNTHTPVIGQRFNLAIDQRGEVFVNLSPEAVGEIVSVLTKHGAAGILTARVIQKVIGWEPKVEAAKTQKDN